MIMIMIMIIIIMALFNNSPRWLFIRIIQNNTKFYSFTPNIICKIFSAGVTFMKLIRECSDVPACQKQTRDNNHEFAILSRQLNRNVASDIVFGSISV